MPKKKTEDRIFNKPLQKMIDFNFNADVASVFDDMLVRSVPAYPEMQRMMGEIAKSFYIKGTNIYDLGCSTGTTLLSLYQAIGKSAKYIGIDYSKPMLEKAEAKFKKNKFQGKLELKHGDLNKDLVIRNASVVVLNLTLQFVRPLNRDKLITSIYKGLKKGGVLILIEKVLGNDSNFNRLFIEYYYDFKKRNGYSELEISQKRETLENVLIPYKLDENFELLKRNGFSSYDVFLKWYNFCGIAAHKN